MSSTFNTPAEALQAIDALLSNKPWSPCAKAGFLRNDYFNLRRGFLHLLEDSTDEEEYSVDLSELEAITGEEVEE